MLRLNKNAAKQNANIYSTCGMYTFLKKLVMRCPEKLPINFFDIFFSIFHYRFKSIRKLQTEGQRHSYMERELE